MSPPRLRQRFAGSDFRAMASATRAPTAAVTPPTSPAPNASCISDDFVIAMTWGSIGFILLIALLFALAACVASRNAEDALKAAYGHRLRMVKRPQALALAIPHDADRREAQIWLDFVRAVLSGIWLAIAGALASGYFNDDDACSSFFPALAAALVVVTNGFFSALQECIRAHSRLWVLYQIAQYLKAEPAHDDDDDDDGDAADKGDIHGWYATCFQANKAIAIAEVHDNESARYLKEMYTQIALITAAVVGVISATMPSQAGHQVLNRNTSISVVSFVGSVFMPLLLGVIYKGVSGGTVILAEDDKRLLAISDFEQLVRYQIAHPKVGTDPNELDS